MPTTPHCGDADIVEQDGLLGHDVRVWEVVELIWIRPQASVRLVGPGQPNVVEARAHDQDIPVFGVPDAAEVGVTLAPTIAAAENLDDRWSLPGVLRTHGGLTAQRQYISWDVWVVEREHLRRWYLVIGRQIDGWTVGCQGVITGYSRSPGASRRYASRARSSAALAP